MGFYFLYNLNTECMRFLEKNLEDIIWESDNAELKKRNLYIGGKKFRQSRIGNFGISDIITVRKEFEYCYEEQTGVPILIINIMELKKEKVGISAFLQSIRYAKGVKSYLDKYKPNLNYTIDITLIGREVDKSGDFIFITDLIRNDFGYNKSNISNIDFYCYDYLIDGINFTKVENFTLTNKGF